MKILVVDDEKLLVKGIKFNLENEGYTVEACYDGEAAVSMAKNGNYDLIILDLMMPKKDGLEACQEIRSFSTVPIIMLTARSDVDDKVTGLDSGADDYLTKPFMAKELLARLRALIRRNSSLDDGKLSFGDIVLDTSDATLSCTGTGQSVRLSEKEMKIPPNTAIRVRTMGATTPAIA